MIRSISTSKTTRTLTLLILALAMALPAACGPAAPAAQPAPSPTQPPAAQAPAQGQPATQPPAQATQPAPTQPAATPVPTQVPTPVPTAQDVAAGTKGGSLSLAFTDDPNSMDSILGYNLPGWQSLFNLYRGLMIYKGDRAVPDMADGDPQLSADGTVYTIKIKPGIKFSNGREVEAADFKYSMERCLDPEWASWANYYLTSIKGAQDVVDGKTKEVTGIEVVDKHTLRITLNAPDMTFVNSLALPEAWPVPKEEVTKWGKDFEKHPVGAGPFILKEYTVGEKAVFVPNPYYYVSGEPAIDEQVMYFGVDRSTALMRIEKGELDVLFGDMVPSADVPRLFGDAKYKDWLYQEPAMVTFWMGLNNKVAPFDNLAVRQALNLAINKDKIVKLTGGRATALYGIYPATAPGYQADYKPYKYDPAAAKAKLAASGVANPEFEMLITEDPLEASIAQAIQQDLGQVGIKMSIKQTSGTASLDLIAGGKAQAYSNHWYMIQPDVADLINNLYTTNAGSNQDFYANAKVDELGKQALAEQDRAKRLKLYQDIERLLMDDAVHVPLYTGISFYVHSPRIQNFTSRSEYGPYFEKMWIKK